MRVCDICKDSSKVGTVKQVGFHITSPPRSKDDFSINLDLCSDCRKQLKSVIDIFRQYSKVISLSNIKAIFESEKRTKATLREK